MGVSCATCIVPIRKQLVKLNGVKSISANVVADLVFVDYDPKIVDAEGIIGAIKKAGFTAVPATMLR